MEAEKLEVVGWVVPNLDKAIELFSDIFETEFVNYGELTTYKEGEKTRPGELRREVKLTEHFPMPELPKVKMAIDRKGLIELIETIPPSEGRTFSNVHIKVPDIEKAKAELEGRGMRLMAEVVMGGYKEAVFRPGRLYGIPIVFCEYDAPSLADALIQGQDWQP